MTDVTLDAAELKRLHEQATPGPWELHRSTISWWLEHEKDRSRCWIGGHLAVDTWRDTFSRERAMADPELITYLRNNVPAILALQAQLDEALAVLRNLKPDNMVNIPEWIPDNFQLPMDVTAGELRPLFAILAKQGGNHG